MQDEKTRIDTILREQYDILPTGTILMYNGNNWQNDSTIPGWYMCDGQNGTPDLRERFIAGCSYSTKRTIPNAPGKFGGENSFTLKTDNLPAHTHSIPAHNHTATVGSGGSFSDNITTGVESSGHIHFIGSMEPTGSAGVSYKADGSHGHYVFDCSSDYYESGHARIDGTYERDRHVSGSKKYDNEDGSHHHNCSGPLKEDGSKVRQQHTHSFSLNIPAHSHSITIASGGSGNTGSIGGNAAVDLTKSVKGYAVIFIQKNR